MAFWNDPSALTPKQSHRWVISFGAHDSKIWQAEAIPGQNIIPYYFAKNVDKPSYEIGVQQAKYLYSHNFNFPKRLTWKPITITFYDVIAENGSTNFLFKPTVQTYKDLSSTGPSRTTIQQRSGRTIARPDIIVEEYERVKQSTQLFFYKFLQESGFFDPEEYNKDDQLLRFRKYNFKKDMIRSFIGEQRNFNFTQNEKIPINTDIWYTLDITEIDAKGNATETWKLYAPLISDVKFDKLDYSSENVLSITVTIHYDWAKLVPAKNIEKVIRKEGTTKIPEIDVDRQLMVGTMDRKEFADSKLPESVYNRTSESIIPFTTDAQTLGLEAQQAQKEYDKINQLSNNAIKTLSGVVSTATPEGAAIRDITAERNIQNNSQIQDSQSEIKQPRLRLPISPERAAQIIKEDT